MELIPLVLACLLVSGAAQAAKVNVLAGISMQNPTSDSSLVVYKSGTAMTFGATVDFSLMPLFDIETGLISVGAKFSDVLAGLESKYSTRAWESPLLLRFTALSFLDFGLGGYVQKINSTYDVDAAGIKATGDWTAAYKTTDIGAKASARVLLPIAPLTGIGLDLAYKLGMTNLSKSGSSLKTNELAALATLSFGF
jgi:hypothetical protein